MKIAIYTDNAELKQMGLDADELKDAVARTLRGGVETVEGELAEIVNFTIHVDVLPSRAEFKQVLREAGVSGQKQGH